MTELQELLDAVNGEIYGVWFLIGAALVFWMQAGFALSLIHISEPTRL